METYRWPRLELGYSKNVEDWAIRSQAPKLAMIEHGEGSTTRRLWVSKDGLINLMRHKVKSGPDSKGQVNFISLGE